jgi:transcriptional regulator with XRE-family HTH domain
MKPLKPETSKAVKTSGLSKEKANTSKKDIYGFEYMGERIAYVRKFVGESREHLATILEITIQQYGLLENKTSASNKVLAACINYFAMHYNINSAWIIEKYNEGIPLEKNIEKDLSTMITEMNSKLSSQGLMVNLVSKT